MSDIKFRRCTPKDADDVVPLIYASGPAAFSYVFKTNKHNAQAFLHYAFTRLGGEFSFDNHYALILGAKLVGVGSVFNAKKAQRFSTKDFMRIAGCYKTSCIPVIRRGLMTEHIIKNEK